MTVSLGGLADLSGTVDHAQDVALLHDQEIFALKADFGARPFAEQDPVARLHIQRDELAGLVASAGANGEDFASGVIVELALDTYTVTMAARVLSRYIGWCVAAGRSY